MHLRACGHRKTIFKQAMRMGVATAFVEVTAEITAQIQGTFAAEGDFRVELNLDDGPVGIMQSYNAKLNLSEGFTQEWEGALGSPKAGNATSPPPTIKVSLGEMTSSVTVTSNLSVTLGAELNVRIRSRSSSPDEPSEGK